MRVAPACPRPMAQSIVDSLVQAFVELDNLYLQEALEQAVPVCSTEPVAEQLHATEGQDENNDEGSRDPQPVADKLLAAEGPAENSDEGAQEQTEPFCSTEPQPVDEEVLAEVTWNFPWLPKDNLITGRSLLGQADRRMTSTSYMRFFREPGLGEVLHFAAFSTASMGNLDRRLDCLSLLGDHQVIVNGQPPHGHWQIVLGPEEFGPEEFLDINLNCKYGEPNSPDAGRMGKCLRFQRTPGTKTWMRIEVLGDHSWVIVLSILAKQQFQTDAIEV